MTDTEKLRKRIQSKGFRLEWIAEKLGISRFGFSFKLNNKSEFKPTEIKKLCELLDISELEMIDYFFVQKVD